MFGKRCPSCKRLKSIREFSKPGPPGRAPLCKDCIAKTGKEHMEATQGRSELYRKPGES